MKNISAKVLAHSISKQGIELITMQVTAPKYLDAETEKHRMLSSNASSDRAIPFKSMSERDYFLPTDIRLNEKGMQGSEIMSDDEVAEFHEDLIKIHGYTVDILKNWNHVHKQHLNRYLMGFSWQDKIITGTEWDNFYERRLAMGADPAIQQMAKDMLLVHQSSVPEGLLPGEWHLPYVTDAEKFLYGSEACRSISAGRTARASYYNHDKSDPVVGNDINLSNDLLAMKHPTPFENQATPMDDRPMLGIDEGITHQDYNGVYWSGNIRGWVQNRQLLSI